MRKSVLYFSLLLNVFLAGIAAMARLEGGDKCPINWRNTSNFPVPDTVYIHDTVKIIDPTPTSETFLGYDTAMLERADKRADIGENNGLFYVESQGNTGKNLPISVGIDSAPDTNVASKSAHLTNEVSKSGLKEEADAMDKLLANCRQVSSGNAPESKESGTCKNEHVPENVDMDIYSDSVPVLVPITQRVYKDSTCTVWVSGYNPTVDSVHVYKSAAYYPVVPRKGYDAPDIVVTLGPYMGFGNKGFNYGICVTVGVPLRRRR